MGFYEKVLKELYENFKKKNIYLERNAGDIQTFRYPHLEKYSINFQFDKKNNVFVLNNDINVTINGISTNEITVYELLNQTAKKLHLYDFLGYKASFSEKYKAYRSICKDYEKNVKNGKWFYDTKIEKINIKDLLVRNEFSYIKTFINKSKNNDIFICRFENTPSIFQFGSTLKGTNIVFIDNNDSNYGQEIFHIIYHLEEGIPGFNNDNLNIIEKWADVPYLYLMQLLEGRLVRRVRQKTSPHDIKFLDYVFLRAYIGQAFVDENENPYYHSIYSLIEPSIKLLISSFSNKDIIKINELLIDGICYDKTDNIKNEFNSKYGEGSYEKIYFDFNLFNRLDSLKEICEKNNVNIENVYKDMFNKNRLINTVIDYKLVALIWFSKKINSDKKIIIDLVEDYSNLAIKNNKTIKINDFIDHVKSKFGNKKSNMITNEYQLYINVLEKL